MKLKQIEITVYFPSHYLFKEKLDWCQARWLLASFNSGYNCLTVTFKV